jgi:hypothetical protein
VLASKPVAYWRLTEWAGPTAVDATGNKHAGTYEDGIAFYLDGPPSAAFSGDGTVNRAAHFAGGRLKGSLKGLGDSYTVELWFWNGLPNDARAVTGYLFSRGAAGAADGAGDHLALGGKEAASGRLVFFNGNKRLAGTTGVIPKTWNHVALVRDGEKVQVYLNGAVEPEIRGTAARGYAAGNREVFIGGRNDNVANWEGKIDEVAVYDRALPTEEVARHYKASGLAAKR